MKKRLLAVLLLCAALMLSACQTAQKSAPETSAEGSDETVMDAAEGTPEEDGAETFEEEGADPTYSPLAGTWMPEHGMGILTIYQNGGFLLEGEESLEGYLVFTEEDAGTGLSYNYELYLENNEPVPGRCLSLDDAYPGKLVYTTDGESVLYARPDSVYDDDGVALRVVRSDENVLSSFDEVQNFTCDDGEYATDIVFCAGKNLADFRFLAIAWQDSNEDGSFFSTEELYAAGTLTPECPLVVRTSFPGDMPTNGFAYTDADGVTQYYAVLESGFDTSLCLSSFKLSTTP